MNLDIKNTATDWHKFLMDLAMEANGDAATTDPQLTLHGVLTDLALVAKAYAGRLDVERGGEAATLDDVSAVCYRAPPSDDLTDLMSRIVMLEALASAPSVESALPDWLNEVLGSLANRIEALEQRVTDLENNQQKTAISPMSPFALEAADVIDDNPDAWDNIDRARIALRSMVIRTYRQRVATRQRILDRVTYLARMPERDSEANAELAQHEARAKEFGEIDVLAQVKADEIAGIDDLDVAREYAERFLNKGWPE